MEKHGEQSAILHDAYFNKSPGLVRLFLVRLVLLCGLSASAVAAIADLYLVEIPYPTVCGITAAVTGVIYILASVLPAWIIYPACLGGCGALLLNESLCEQLSCFWDLLMIKLDSRFLQTQSFTFHDFDMLKNGAYTQELHDSRVIGFVFAGALLGLLLTMCSRTRFRPLRAMLCFALFAAPAFVAEIAGFHISIVIFSAFYFALYAVRMAYELDGMFVFDKTRAAGDAVRRNERSYRRRTMFSVLGQKLRNDIPRYLKYNANSIIAFATTLSVMLATAYIIPSGTTFDHEKIFSEIKNAGLDAAEKMENAFGVDFGAGKAADEYFSYSGYGDNSGGIGISKPSDSERPVLDVILERNDIPVYLRGDIGVNFTGDGWTALRDEYKKVTYGGEKQWQKIKDFYSESQYQITRQKLSFFGYNPDLFLPLQKVSVTYHRKTNVIFQPLAPYELDYRENGYFETFGDTVYRKKGGSGYLNTYESLALTPNMDYTKLQSFFNDMMLSSYRGEWTIPNGLTNEEYDSCISAYKNFVKGAYSNQSYDNIGGLMDALYNGGYVSPGMSLHQISDGICRYFKENFTYSLTVDNGTGEEVLDSFLYETKQGHCALFATCAVLAMRELGYEARYVTGYVVSGNGNFTSEGYLYTLRENNLHAWIEVYFDEVGWLPFDPTASVAGFTQEAVNTLPTATVTSISSVDADNPVSETEIGGEESPSEENTLTPPEKGENGEVITPSPISPEPKDENKLIPVIVTILCVILAAGLAVLAVYLLIKRVNEAEKRVMNGFRKKNPNRAVAEMYKLSMIVLEKVGLIPECEMMADFAERVDASIFLKGANVFMVDVMPVFVKCEFGNAEISPVTEEERAAVYRFTAVVYRKYMENLGSVKRFIAKISLFL